MSKFDDLKHSKRNLLALAISWLLPCLSVNANPTNPQVMQGSAGFSNQGSALAITNSNGTIINWQSFSINPGETTRFNQPSSDSSVLNRVTGPDPSQLLGTLSSNGQVFLINPSGILVGQGAIIDVAGFVASNLNLNPANFKADNLKFHSDSLTRGKVENLGEITTPNGGSVYLVGSEVSNQGIIQSPQGQIILASGQTVEIHDTATPNVSVVVTGNDNLTTNLGQLVAASGQIGILGALVTNNGLINANQIIQNESGRIFLRASQDLNIGSASSISADGNSALAGSSAGNINLESSQGNINIQADATITTNGATGGIVQINADQGSINMAGVLQAIGSSANGGSVGLFSNANPLSGTALPSQTLISGNIDVSGANGGNITVTGYYAGLINANLTANGLEKGGNILIGGGMHGLDSTVPNAQATYIDAASSINANGGVQLLPSSANTQTGPDIGNGGQIIAWSDQSTRVYGQLSATGGSQGGNGGFIETSGHWLDVSGIQVNAAAPQGQSGQWLLDPYSLTVGNSNSTGSNAPSESPPGSGNWLPSTSGSSTVSKQTISTELSNGTSVTLTSTGSSGTGTGDIVISSAINTTNNSTTSLTLNSYNNIDINAAITSSTGMLTLYLNAGIGTANGTSSISSATVNLDGGALTYTRGLTLSGTLQNSSLSSGDQSPLGIGPGGTLNGVKIASNLTVNSTNNAYVDNSLTLDSGVTLDIGADNLYFLNGNQSINTTGSATMTLEGGSLNLPNSPPETLTIGTGITLKGYGSLGNNNPGEYILNNGIIIANSNTQSLTLKADDFTNNGHIGTAAGGILDIAALSFTNNGTLSLSAGTLFIGASSWQNRGTLTETGGTLNLGGSFSTDDLGTIHRSGGALTITGTLDNSGRTLDIGSTLFGTGGLSALYGTIGNGRLVSNDGTLLNSNSGTLDNVTLGSNLTISNSSYLYLNNALTLANGVNLNIGSSTLNFQGSGTNTLSTSSGNATLTMAGGSLTTFSSGQTLTVDNGITLSGYGTIGNSNLYTLINDGTLSVGIVSGAGTSLLTVDGAYQQNSSGVLNLTFNSVINSFNKLNTTGTANLGGTLNLYGTAGIGNYQVLTASPISGSFSTLNTYGQPISLNYSPTVVTVIDQGVLPSTSNSKSLTANFLTTDIMNFSNFYAQTVVATSNLAIITADNAGTRPLLNIPAMQGNSMFEISRNSVGHATED